MSKKTPLGEAWVPLVIAEDDGVVGDPDDPAVGPHEPVLGMVGDAFPVQAFDLVDDFVSIVGVQAPLPQVGVAGPLLCGVAEHVLHLWAGVDRRRTDASTESM